MITWYRLCFDPRKGTRRFENSEEFDKWLSIHFADFEYKNAGYIICPAHEVITSKGIPLWNILIMGKSSCSPCDMNILVYLSKHGWVIDNKDVLFYVKHVGENERLFPIREKFTCAT